MKKIIEIIKKVEQIIDKSFLEKNSGAAVLSIFLIIITARIFEEQFLVYSVLSTSEIIAEYVYNLLFFANSSILTWLIISFFLKKNPAKLTTIMLWSSFLILFPPIIDMIKTDGNIFWSFYLLNSLSGLWEQFITIFGNLPSGIVYYGSKIVAITSIILASLIVCIKTKNIIKASLTALVVYMALFFMGSFPSWITYGYYFFQGKNITEVTAANVAQFFGSPRLMFGLDASTLKYAFPHQLDILLYLFLIILLQILFFSISREKLWAIFKNSRFPQIIYHSGLLFVGMGLGFWIYPQNLNLNFFSTLLIPVLWISVFLAWLTSVIVNDIYDFEVDAVSNSDRPLQKKVFTVDEYRELGIIFFILSILGGAVVDLKFAALLFIYQFIAWLYSAKPYRLKKFPIVATFMSAVASLIIVFIGFALFSGPDNLRLFPWRVGFLLLITLTLSLPIKDFKDIEGDKKDGTWTIPVLFGMEKGKIIIASGIFISFILSVFFLNESKLFWWALFFGAGTFLIVTHKKIQPQRLFWWILAPVFIYGLILVKVIFLK